MDKEKQTQIDIELHQFGQRMRAAWTARQAEFEKNFAAFKEGVRDDWQRQHDNRPEPPSISPSKERERDLGEPER